MWNLLELCLTQTNHSMNIVTGSSIRQGFWLKTQSNLGEIFCYKGIFCLAIWITGSKIFTFCKALSNKEMSQTCAKTMLFSILLKIDYFHMIYTDYGFPFPISSLFLSTSPPQQIHTLFCLNCSPECVLPLNILFCLWKWKRPHSNLVCSSECPASA